MIHIQEEAARCLFCADAPCSKACRQGDPARAVRAVRFGNEAIAHQWVKDCTEEDLEAAEKACIHYDRPVRIREIVKVLGDARSEPGMTEKAEPDMTVKTEPAGRPSLAIDFCGIRCESPFFLASSAVCTSYDMVARAFEAGWAGVFYKTICMQEIREVSPRFDAMHAVGTSDFYSFRNMEQLSENPVEVDFDILKRLKQNYPKKVVIASIMGQKEEEWIELARKAEAAGCDAVELNFSCPQMRLAGMGSDVGQDPELVLFYTSYVTRNVKIPVIPKMTPNITDINQPAMASFFAGAHAISAINTIKSVTMDSRSEVSGRKCVSGMSGRAVKPIALRHVLEMTGNPVLNGESGYGKTMEFSGIGGIETWRDALEFIQLGCRNVQVCTAVMQYGQRIVEDLTLGLQNYMASRGISDLADLVGEKLPAIVKASDLDRDTIVYPRMDREKCIGCGRCYTSCQDGGHQAISFGEDRKPRVNGAKCVGCLLCHLVCPTGAISLAKRVEKRRLS